MALMRGFSKVDEEGRITIPDEIARFSNIHPGYGVHLIVLRLKGTGRFPHLVIHRPGNVPYISTLEVMMKREQGEADERGRLTLPAEIMEDLRLEPGYLVEFKIHGARGQHWVVVHNRGPWRMTTHQERLGSRRKGEKQWKTITVEY